ncbi:MAG: hypothetical protein IRY94_02480 [Rhodospirillaceae bacterium]|nr:hypothetical protein [Rhodospirillaceae bacterium]
MSWFVWGVLGWTLLSLPLGVVLGRVMARMNPSTEASDWQQIRNELTEMMPGSGMAVARVAPTREQARANAAGVARKVA